MKDSGSWLMVGYCLIGLERLLDRLMLNQKMWAVFSSLHIQFDSTFFFLLFLVWAVWYRFTVMALTSEDFFYILRFNRDAYNTKVLESLMMEVSKRHSNLLLKCQSESKVISTA